MPKTEAGKRMLDWLEGAEIDATWSPPIPATFLSDGLDAIEAEAIATERARLREEVEGMAGWLTPAGVRDDPLSDPVSRASVLALLEGGTR